MKVFISRKLPEAGLKLLQEAGCIITEYTDRKELSQDDLIKACAGQDALISIGPNKLNEPFFKACGHLKVISLLSVGFDNVDVAAATLANIPVGNTPDVLSKATSDVAFLLMLATSRKAFFMHQQIINGNWGFYDPNSNLGQELYNKTLGIFGLGKIGLELARKCKLAYNMNIIYHNRRQNMEAEKELDARYVSFDELLQQSDVLSVHANLSKETKGLFNKAAFAKMKPTAIFINTARGEEHNEADLIAALEQHIIWGAGLDVSNPEPMAKDNPLLFMPSVCVLPHIGSATMEARSAMAVLAAQNILAGLQGRPLPHIINKEVYH
ncbi:MAG: D-glycerate dehydrogenase [Candidatus Pseudobacter hemicellulosilyticus]|uniref:Glyoxylate/hydroxypyruvate reductase B n=1 Tax=Candidatus Pseudobacter hemicellulosilyticus TaxID=3121375 RepID=A0AAJ5WQ99_9BACT|nr:MAG: D-glycerate dehydrogenase [Pseudobacter sp.]